MQALAASLQVGFVISGKEALMSAHDYVPEVISGQLD